MYGLSEVRANQTETEKIMRRRLRDLPKRHREALTKCARHVGGGYGVLKGSPAQLRLAHEALDMIWDALTSQEAQAVEAEAMRALGGGVVA